MIILPYWLLTPSIAFKNPEYVSLFVSSEFFLPSNIASISSNNIIDYFGDLFISLLKV
jgi:hypothetical protein